MENKNLITMFPLVSSKEDFVLKEVYQHLYIYQTSRIDKAISTYGAERYLDYFYIVLPNDAKLRNIFWQDFYTHYGSQYEKHVDINNNISCIIKLLGLLEEKKIINSHSHILDYGCGSGLSFLTKWKHQLIGYENVDVMRLQAEKRGMYVISPDNIPFMQNHYFDAVFGSYVFHMINLSMDIERILPLIKKDAPWIMNFYKNKNISQVKLLFANLGYSSEIIEEGSCFGNIYIFKKTKDILRHCGSQAIDN